MKRTHISNSLDRTWLLPLISISVLSLVVILAVSHTKSSSSASDFAVTDQVLRNQLAQPKLPGFAYLISGTRGDVPRVKRVLQAVYHPRNYYVLHLDLEASDGERLELAKYVKSESVTRDFKNVMVVGKANLITYKGPTMIASTLHAVAILLKQAKDWDWFINLSASDYPLVPQDDLLHIFSYLPRDLNFLEHTGSIGWKEYQRARPIIIDPGLYHSKKSGVFWAKEKRSLPASFKLFTGPLAFNITAYEGGIPQLVYYPYSWTNRQRQQAFYLWMHTGFSYASSAEAYATSDTLTAAQVYQFLKKWLVDHPQHLKSSIICRG